ncbi:(S)-benzoin forming benzil reductase [Cytobacillus sp. Hz8]|uniref:(S)-benzoin forming benzil reductase n=1 Tax=Cytobacillus sp. Hz8 TaxID=3347168 RepID=UPI0035E30336
MKLAIITGASKGLGYAITEKLMEEKFAVITISRTENKQLKSAAEKLKLFYQFFSCDFTQLDEIENAFQQIGKIMTSTSFDSIYLFNNAGVVEPIEAIGHLNSQALISNIQVNLMAPMLITNIMLEWVNAPLTIINVTSGAAERPFHGWSAYCSTKAGINMFSQTFALEQEISEGKHKILAFNPSIMDTEMQSAIRSSSKDAFHLLEQFQDYKKEGMLRSPEVVANALIQFVLKDDYKSGQVYHVNDLL